MPNITVDKKTGHIDIEGDCGSKWEGECEVVDTEGSKVRLECKTELVEECEDMEIERLIDDIMHEGEACASSEEIAKEVVENLREMGISADYDHRGSCWTVYLTSDNPGHGNPNGIYSRIYNKLIKVVPIKLIEKGVESGKSKVSGFMDLNYDFLRRDEHGNPIIALSHYYRHPSGDMIPDPDMEIKVMLEQQEAEAMTYQDSFGYRQVYYHDEYEVDIRAKKELNQFLDQWLSNLIEQGHKIMTDNPGNPGPACPPGQEETDGFCAERYEDPENFDPDSYRTICPKCPGMECDRCKELGIELKDTPHIVIGCPKGEWDPKKGVCIGSTRRQSILRPKSHASHYGPKGGNPGNPGKEIIIKYRVVPFPETDPRGLIFDTREEAEEWLRLADVDLPIEEVKGTIGTGYQRTGFLTTKAAKVWTPIES